MEHIKYNLEDMKKHGTIVPDVHAIANGSTLPNNLA